MAEDARQEIEIVILGKTYKVRPSWQALSAVENATGTSAYEMGMRMMSIRSVGITEVAIVLRALAQTDPENGKNAPTVDEIGADLFENGYRNYIIPNPDTDEGAGPIPRLLVSGLKGHKIHMKEAAAGGTTVDPPKKD